MGDMIDKAIEALIRQRVQSALERYRDRLLNNAKNDKHNTSRFPTEEYLRLYAPKPEDFV